MRIATPDLHVARHARLRARLSADGLDTLLVSSSANIAYLTGLFASAAALLVDQQELQLIVDGRYTGAARLRQTELPGLVVVLVASDGSFEETVAARVGATGDSRVGFDADHLSVRQHQDLVSRVTSSGTKAALISAAGLVEGLRAVKDAWDDILLSQLDNRHRPCNLVELMPRLQEHLKAAE